MIYLLTKTIFAKKKSGYFSPKIGGGGGNVSISFRTPLSHALMRRGLKKVRLDDENKTWAHCVADVAHKQANQHRANTSLP